MLTRNSAFTCRRSVSVSSSNRTRSMPPAVDGGELLGGCQPVRPIVLRRDARVHLLLQPRYPDLEELVQIGAEDREELEPLEQRVRAVGRLLQHAAVELEPGELAVEVVIRRV